MSTAGWIPAARSRSSRTARRVSSAAASSAGDGVTRRASSIRMSAPHQPLLGAVVEVAADPAPLGRGGARQPRARARRAPPRGPARRRRARVPPRTPAARRCRGRRRRRRARRRSETAPRRRPPAPSSRHGGRTSPARRAPCARSCAPAAAGTRSAGNGVPSGRVWWIVAWLSRPSSSLGAVVAEHGQPGRVDQPYFAARADEVDRIGHAVQHRIQQVMHALQP